MRVYFDTNVYRLVRARGQVESVSRYLRGRRINLVASSENLFETYAISDVEARRQELSALTRLATSFERAPGSYRQAAEVRAAVIRHRRHWLRKVTFTRSIRQFRRAHQRRWREACRGNPPDPSAYAAYQRDAESVLAQSREAQKHLRGLRIAELKATLVRRLGDQILVAPVTLDDPKTFWRLDCLWTYDAALIERHPGCRDLADWLLPVLKPSALTFEEFGRFWLTDVGENDVPRNHLAGLVSYFQLAAKITHGNSADQLHACNAFDVDVLLTADRSFYDALAASREYAAARLAAVGYVDRAAVSALDEISRLLV